MRPLRVSRSGLGMLLALIVVLLIVWVMGRTGEI